ncbi:D-lactate dehydrogenase [Chromohalobacter sp. HP20-39]|uniref:D-lactate dehydrogenase n=1 Tax=Chromohalobacter sp. HP20-39 TaxID=3079306 RepID=UPI00294AD3E5|nr:D-lactate dehydrogenase [Chromohalobacter sp. HP20-39]MDV6317989.1 D-lactate dehydrogenase [Chromohalobacter sp. HP20-39]
MSIYKQSLERQPSIREKPLEFVRRLEEIVGKPQVLKGEDKTRRYRTGFRFGSGRALAVVRPRSLLEQWRVLKACLESDCIVITQAANTGLTGGSTPDGDDYDRDIVIINTMRLKIIQPIEGGRQVICLPGATLDQLEKLLAPMGREPHSVIGSSCIGASVFGGVCNNSGGSLVKRGPAYTELALYARLNSDGCLELVNHLGIKLGEKPEQILKSLQNGDYSAHDIEASGGRAASDRDYIRHVRDIHADTPARFNADPRRLNEAAGSAGRLMVFALRLDTFPMEKNPKVFYIGTNHTTVLTGLRRRILTEFEILPIAGEYMHRDAYDIAKYYGKDTFLTIQHLGTHRLPTIWERKGRFDDFCTRVRFLPANASDRIMQKFSRLFPEHLPKRMDEYRDSFEHHLMLKVCEENVDRTRKLLDNFFIDHEGSYFECSDEEGKKAFLHRFAAAGAAGRYRVIHDDEVEDIVALDVALRRNEREWMETLPHEVDKKLLHKLYYGHFLCHVIHQDYIVRKGVDCLELEYRMWAQLDERGAEYPAEHNVGHLYMAKPVLRDFYRQLDPCNYFNPGIGKTSKKRFWDGRRRL